MITLHITELKARDAEWYRNPKHTDITHTGKLSRTAIVRAVKRTLGLQGKRAEVDVFTQGITIHTDGKVIFVDVYEERNR
jgi:hypothetical protein